MNHAEIDGLMKALAPIVADFTVKAIAPLRAENERLAGCVSDLEKRFADVPSREDHSVLILRLVEEKVSPDIKYLRDELDALRPNVESIGAAIAEEIAETVAKSVIGISDGIHPVVAREVKDAVAGLDLRAVITDEVEKAIFAKPPKDGKDADPTLIAELVDKAVSALEPAKDGAHGEKGEPGNSVTVEMLAPMVTAFVTEKVAREIEKVVPTIPAGPQGEPGKSVEIEDIVPLIAAEVERAVAEIPKPENGKDADPAEIAALLIPEVEKAVAQLPKAENGKDGTSVSIDNVAPLIAEEVSKAVAAIPVPQAGRDGRDGLPGIQGEKGIDGRDGVDGKDGFGIDDFEFKSENEGRTLVLSLKQADRDPIVQEVQTSIILDRGVWREQEYAKGDGVTWGGSFFIAQRDTASNEKPEAASDAWRLSIKRGRDGKDGKDGKPGDRGPEGKAGRDMTQRAF